VRSSYSSSSRNLALRRLQSEEVLGEPLQTILGRLVLQHLDLFVMKSELLICDFAKVIEKSVVQIASATTLANLR
jgi:hypothetical protein